MRLRNPSSPAADDLRSWAYDASAPEPMQDWELVLSWQVDRGFLAHCVQYAADPDCPKALFFLDVLYKWVDTVARDPAFEINRAMYDDWLDGVRGIASARVKDWRHQARLVFQNVAPFNRERWWEAWFAVR
jgi:hypothetical protein